MTSHNSPVTIAIDGPSGSGKSSVAKGVAAQLGLAYLDTGAMYRAVTWWCLRQGVDLHDKDAVTAAARDLPLEMGTDPAAPSFHVDGIDVAEEIRTSEISSQVSLVATNVDVREVLIAWQRRIVADARATGGIVLEGRDTTTVVAEDAEVRMLVTASEEARLARRAREVRGGDDEAAMKATADEVVRRDRDDSTAASFMEPAPGVTLVDTTELDLPGSIQAALGVVRDRMGTA